MNYIITNNITETKLENAVSELVELYYETGFVNSVIVNRVRVNHFMIEFPDNPDFERFLYFVNYLTYPECKYDGKPFIYGIWNVVEPNHSIDSRTGEKLLIYVSQFDTEYDNVIIENSSGKVFKYSFSGKVSEEKKRELDYQDLIALPENYTEVITIVPTKEMFKYEVKPWWKFW
jgi:hypothetical protein